MELLALVYRRCIDSVSTVYKRVVRNTHTHAIPYPRGSTPIPILFVGLFSQDCGVS